MAEMDFSKIVGLGNDPRAMDLVVFSYMAFPEDAERRNMFLDTFNANVLGRVADNFDGPIGILAVLDPQSLLALVEAPTWEEQVQNATKTSFHGAIVGRMILFLIEMAREGLQTSVGKARFLTANYFDKAANEFGEKGFSGARTISRTWSEYKRVSHLWAAHQLLLEQHGAAGLLERCQSCPLYVAAYGTYFAQLMQELRFWEGQPLSVFDPSELWLLPESIELPSVSFSCSGMSPEDKERLKEYKAYRALNN